jgi:hypothetical protein
VPSVTVTVWLAPSRTYPILTESPGFRVSVVLWGSCTVVTESTDGRRWEAAVRRRGPRCERARTRYSSSKASSASWFAASAARVPDAAATST